MYIKTTTGKVAKMILNCVKNWRVEHLLQLAISRLGKKERVARFSNRWTRYFYRVHPKICRRHALIRRPFASSIYVHLPTPSKVKLSIRTTRLRHTRKFSKYRAVFRLSLDSTTFLPRLQSGARAIILVSHSSTWSAHATSCLFHAVWHPTALEVSAENVN